MAVKIIEKIDNKTVDYSNDVIFKKILFMK
jgi:hypothetical protein